MTKHKISELKGALLDAAVALAEGWKPTPRTIAEFGNQTWVVPPSPLDGSGCRPEDGPLPWSWGWAHGGPIIERARIQLMFLDGSWFACVLGDTNSVATPDLPNTWPGRGETALIAAMRAYVSDPSGTEETLEYVDL